MHDVKTLDLSRIAQDLQIRKVQVENVVQLLDEGNTVPFITRYRKERTGGLNEDLIRLIQGRVQLQRQLAERKQTILKSIEGQGKLTDELKNAILAADHPKRLEDLYLPFKPKKRTLATIAREKGLEPLATAIWSKDPTVANLKEFAAGMINPEKELATAEAVLAAAQHILAEQIADIADVRGAVRVVIWDLGKLMTAKSEKLPDGKGLDFKDYFQFTEPLQHIPPHRILAINRGEKEGALKVSLDLNLEVIERVALEQLPLADHPHAEFIKAAARDSLTRLILPSMEREVRKELMEVAEKHAVVIFARNLRSLLLQPPLHGRRVLAIDPGFRSGCKVAALDEYGNLLDHAVIYPHPIQFKPHGKKTAPPPAAAPAPPAAAAPAAVTPVAETPATVPPAAPTEANETPTSPTVDMPPAAEQAKETSPLPKETPPPPPEEKKEPAPQIQHKRAEAKQKIEELVAKHQLNVIAIGNGTACRETEEFVAELISETANKASPHPQQAAEAPPPPQVDVSQPAEAPVAAEAQASAETPAGVPQLTCPSPPSEGRADLAYVIVNEAGASVYSASAVGREEFPTFDATLRGTISIGRRLQDPLSELVKIDPHNIGVGLYQHDVHPRHLKESLEAVIESSVNHVGVDLNTASVPLLRHVSGLNQLAARDLVEYRKQNGPFRSREQLQQVPNIGPARYVQAAGFLKIIGGDEPLDQTWIHPESYPAARQILTELGQNPDDLRHKPKTDELREKLKSLTPEELSGRLNVGVPTVKDILEALGKPGRDPREDLPPPIFKKGILKLEDLQPGMELKGTVLNVVDFGAFVDVGLKDSGLVHISQMANRYIKNPYEILAVGIVVTVWVLAVDRDRKRVSLSMIKPGTERKPQERRPEQPRPPREGDRPPRGRRHGPRRPSAQVAYPKPGGPVPAPSAEAAGTAVAAPAATAPPPPRHPPRPHQQQHQQQPPRRPHRQPPKPKLTEAALEGKTPLRNFNELGAFFDAKKTDPPPPPKSE